MYSLIIVDDEPEILAGLCSMLRWNDLGFELKAAFTNGEDARKWISTHTCDVVFCDIVMGDFSGLDLADWLRVNYPKTYVMLNSAYEEFHYAQRAIEARVFRYILKPTSIEKLALAFADLKRELDQERSSVSPEPEVLSQHPIIRKVSEYVADHLRDNFSLSEMAHALHYNPSYLSRAFKAECGEGVNEYINRVRIEHARKLLLENDLKVYEVAEAVGFRDLRYFTRQFYASVGETPSVFRKKHHP